MTSRRTTTAIQEAIRRQELRSLQTTKVDEKLERRQPLQNIGRVKEVTTDGPYLVQRGVNVTLNDLECSRKNIFGNIHHTTHQIRTSSVADQ